MKVLTLFSHFIGFIGILSLCSVSKQGHATTQANNAASIPVDSLYEEINKLGLELTRKNHVPGLAVAVLKDGKVAWTQCIGYANVASQKPITPQTVFNVGSISKAVAAWGFMQLAERGTLGMDDPVNESLTRWKLPPSSFDASKVTLRHILSHTAGLSVHGYAGFEEGEKLPTLEESLSGKTKTNGGSVRLISEPGSKWDYSGGGFTLAQLLLEEKTKEDFAAYMRKNVFQPLGMLHTDYDWSVPIKANAATAYDTAGKAIKNRIFTEKAAAGLQTTIMDMARFAELSMTEESKQLNGVLKLETVRSMQQPVRPSSNEGESGLGYQFMNYGSLRTVGHTGENAGWYAAMFLHMPSKSAIIMLCNGTKGLPVMIPIYNSWAKTLKTAQNTGNQK